MPETRNGYLYKPALTEPIVLAAIEVHKQLGPGLLEHAYQDALAQEFRIAGISFQQQKGYRIVYKGRLLPCLFRPDFVINDNVIVEIKSVTKIADIHVAQVINYLRLSGCAVGLLINFNVESIGKGLKRVLPPR